MMAAWVYGESGWTNARPRYNAPRPKVDPEVRALERAGRAAFREGKRMPTNEHKRSGYMAERAAYAATLARIGGKVDLS
jgi:hypothetical protein